MCENNNVTYNLHNAARDGELNKIHYILNETNQDINEQNKLGETALHVAIKHSNSEITKWLLNYSANTELKTNQCYSALHLAIQNNRLVELRMLLEYGATVRLDDDILTYMLLGDDIDHATAALIMLYMVKTNSDFPEEIIHLKRIYYVKYKLEIDSIKRMMSTHISLGVNKNINYLDFLLYDLTGWQPTYVIFSVNPNSMNFPSFYYILLYEKYYKTMNEIENGTAW